MIFRNGYNIAAKTFSMLSVEFIHLRLLDPENNKQSFACTVKLLFFVAHLHVQISDFQWQENFLEYGIYSGI